MHTHIAYNVSEIEHMAYMHSEVIKPGIGEVSQSPGHSIHVQPNERASQGMTGPNHSENLTDTIDAHTPFAQHLHVFFPGGTYM